jgi:shikimate kinase
MTTRQHLVLVGLMGVGKTTVGRRCAERLDREFVDTDDVVRALAGGATVDEIFAAGGEPQFRELERAAVADVCASPAPLVIGCGGGTVVDADNRRRLHDAGVVVWLRAEVAVLAGRVGDGATRPLLAGDPVGALTRLSAMREVAYDAASDVAVDTDDRSVDEVADAVLAAYQAVVA